MSRHQGPTTDHFDGRRFHNLEAREAAGSKDFLRWTVTRKPGSWREWTDSLPLPVPPAEVRQGRLRATFVNHSTLLIQMDGMNLLTDPIWSERASPFQWIGPRRRHAPGVRFEHLPRIDAVLLSHNHYDHLDVSTLARLGRERRPRIIVPLGVGALLRSPKISSALPLEELDWWQSASIGGGLTITSVPAQHFSGRTLRDRNATLWSGYVIQAPSGNVYFCGDSGYGKHFTRIAARFAPIRLALLPIGAFRPQWFMSPVHMSPAEAVRAHQDLGAATSIGIHFGTFRLADDGQDEPVIELKRALGNAGLPAPRFWTLEPGEGREVPS